MDQWMGFGVYPLKDRTCKDIGYIIIDIRQ
jgi:hypothetical protein